VCLDKRKQTEGMLREGRRNKSKERKKDAEKSNEIKKRQRNKESGTAEPMYQRLINGCIKHVTGGRAVCSLNKRKLLQRLSVSQLLTSDKSTN
jgi:hypothetical protein